jgi:hypothetical protein
VTLKFPDKPVPLKTHTVKEKKPILPEKPQQDLSAQ